MDLIPIDPSISVESDPLKVLLKFVGFTDAQAKKVRDEGFDSVDQIGIEILEEEDIKKLAESFGRMTGSNRFSFGIARTKRLIGMMHWIQDHERVSLPVKVVTGVTEDDMRAAWFRATERANARKTVAKQAKTIQAGADPGELKSDKRFYEWDDKWENYLSTIPGQNGVPLSYVIRVDVAPDYDPDTPYVSFVDQTIGCAPLSGAAYISDKRKVHQPSSPT